ncbi:MAG: hypothetical protein DRQ57_16330 [Gammaproteobacteria bacterium]|nr:MAG: hypothetical protein DRQ57_16330 [Gammaproteobacteria bacterium]
MKVNKKMTERKMENKENEDICPTEEYSVNTSGFICDWLTCGPFPNPGEWPNLANWDTDLLASDGGETKIMPTSEMSYKSKMSYDSGNPAMDRENLTLIWRPVRVMTDYREGSYAIDLNAVFGRIAGTQRDTIIGYAFCYIESPADMDAKLKVGSDNGFKAWLNGKLVGSERVVRASAMDQNAMVVKLKKGSNILLLKIEKNTGGYNFMARFTDMKDEPLTTVKVRLPVPAKQNKTFFISDSLVYEAKVEPIPSSEIEYINPEASAIKLPDYSGTSYEAMVPDTLDIQARAALALNGLTGPLDPEADYELYWIVDFFRNPQVMLHDWNDWVQNKFIETLPMMRLVTGSDLNGQVDYTWMDVLQKSIGPDGLYYLPLKGRPWARNNAYMASVIFRADGTTTDLEDESVTQLTHPFTCNRMIGTMMFYYSLDKNPKWKEMIERMIDRLSELAIYKDDYAYFPDGFLEPNAKIVPSAESEIFKEGAMYGRLIYGLSQYYRESGYEPAKVLAGKLINSIRYHSEYYDNEGRYLTLSTMGHHPGHHFHGHAMHLLGMVDYAVAAKDTELKKFLIKSFEWAITKSNSLVGFFPEYIAPDYPTAEVCEATDMIGFALKFSAAGWGDYWDDADRWIRNQFFENQLTSCDWLKDMAKSQPEKPVPADGTSDRVVERNIGSFAGWSSGNDWVASNPDDWQRWQGPGIMHCCMGSGARCIFYIWQHMLQYDEGQLKINLLLNRASPWADVDSYIPYEGRVKVKIKQACKSLEVRMPQWIANDSKYVSCTVNNKVREFIWQDRYLALGSMEKGDEVDISFPIGERTVEERIGGVDYTLIIKGNTVVNIDPPGKNYPLYQREHYRSNSARLKKVKRFVSDKIIEW